MMKLNILLTATLVCLFGFVSLRAESKSENKDGFKVKLEAKLPKGFPAPGPLEKIIIKEYPQYRAAIVGGAAYQNIAFMRLFAHIKQNKIAMTAPVEMALDAKTSDRKSMAFLYKDTSLGEVGSTNAGVKVTDLPAQTYVSIGMSGFETKDSLAKAVDKLETWLKENKGFEATGEPRLLAYNSPMVPKDKRFWEVQIPVKVL